MAESEVLVINPPDWRSLIVSYLREPLASTDPKLANLRVKTLRYTLIDDVLYKKFFTLPYLRCLGSDEADYALREIHEWICGQHLGGRALAHKALKQGYNCPTMKKEARDFVQKYDKCQKFARAENQPLEELL